MATSTSGWNRHGLKSSGSPETPSHAYLYYLTGITFQFQVFNDIESHNLSSCLAIKIYLNNNANTKTNIETPTSTSTSTTTNKCINKVDTNNDINPKYEVSIFVGFGWKGIFFSQNHQDYLTIHALFYVYSITGTSTRAWVWWRLTNLGAGSL